MNCIPESSNFTSDFYYKIAFVNPQHFNCIRQTKSESKYQNKENFKYELKERKYKLFWFGYNHCMLRNSWVSVDDRNLIILQTFIYNN